MRLELGPTAGLIRIHVGLDCIATKRSTPEKRIVETENDRAVRTEVKPSRVTRDRIREATAAT